MRRQNLKDYKTPKSWHRGASIFKEILWVAIFKPIVKSSFPGSKWREICLIIFGADLGKGIRLTSSLNVTMPWRLKIGDFCWIGEETWINNLALVSIAENVCISQGVYLCTGNHNYKKTSFDLIVKPIIIDSDVWIGAKSIIGPGYKIGKGSIITLGSVISENIPENSLYKNNQIFNFS